MDNYRFRNGPVPHTGHGRGLRHYFRSYYRYPKTTNEKRWYYACDNSQMIRRRRSPIQLPSAWEDISRHLERNWKRQSRNKRQHSYDQVKLRSLKYVYDIDEQEE